MLCILDMQMYGGKEMRSDLIQELRTTHALQSPEQKEKKQEMERILSQQRIQKAEQNKVRN